MKLAKKGDLTECPNWRGITLLPLPYEVLASIMLDRMKLRIDKILTEEQSGLRSGRSCNDAVIRLRRIIESVVEFSSTSAINFIDFQEAFDSVDREGSEIWNTGNVRQCDKIYACKFELPSEIGSRSQ